ncbi:MAG: hypothetical protein NTX50_24480 [Candidatus Sumerlaeota bacterium]|nr:hypothetical protein [Candidatus Sumerlaeota bacterium]
MNRPFSIFILEDDCNASGIYAIADALLNNDGSAERRTGNISCTGRVNGAISFNGSTDCVTVLIS